MAICAGNEFARRECPACTIFDIKAINNNEIWRSQGVYFHKHLAEISYPWKKRMDIGLISSWNNAKLILNGNTQ
jgi:hypothetical protein